MRHPISRVTCTRRGRNREPQLPLCCIAKQEIGIATVSGLAHSVQNEKIAYGAREKRLAPGPGHAPSLWSRVGRAAIWRHMALGQAMRRHKPGTTKSERVPDQE